MDKMASEQQRSFKKIKKVISLVTPSLIAIALLELVNAEIYFYGPFSEKENLFTAWNLL